MSRKLQQVIADTKYQFKTYCDGTNVSSTAHFIM